MSVDDARMTNAIRHEIVKRCVDSSRLEVRVCHGVVYLGGEVRQLPGQPVDLKKEMDTLHHVLRNRPGIRDVVDDCQLIQPLKL